MPVRERIASLRAAVQWWFFGLLAVIGFLYLAYDEWRGPRPGRRGIRGFRPAPRDAAGRLVRDPAPTPEDAPVGS